jgi:hypothetical protein
MEVADLVEKTMKALFPIDRRLQLGWLECCELVRVSLPLVFFRS